MTDTVTEQRRRLRAAGFSPLPLEGKIPAAKAWQNGLDINDAEIHLWPRVYPLAHDTGILCRSTPALDVDLHNAEAADAVEALARERFQERGDYFLVRVGEWPKRAVLFRTDAPFKKITRNLIAPSGHDEKLEFLADGQQIVVFGIHPTTGQPYTWHGGQPGDIKHEDLPYVSESEARAFVADAVQLLTTEFGYTAHAPRPREKKGNSGARPGSGTASAGAPEANGGGGEEDWAALFENIHAGAALHETICSLAAKLVHTGMGDGAAVNLLRALMDNCRSPRDARWQSRYDDIPRAVATAREKFTRSDGNAAEWPAGNPWRQNARTLRELRAMTFNPVVFMVPNIIPAEGVTLICAKPKVGKSWLLLDLCIAATSDRFTLGSIKPVQGSVLYLALEDSMRRLQSRATKLLPTFSGEWPEHLTLATDWRRVDQGGLDDIRDWVETTRRDGRKIAFIAIDVLKRVRPATSRTKPAYDADYEAIIGLHKLAVELDIAIVMTHHTRKAEAEDLIDKVSGTFGLVGAADTIIVIERRGGGWVLDVRGRDVTADELAAEFSKTSCRWTILGPAAEVHRSAERNAVLIVFEDAKGAPLTVADVTAGLEVSQTQSQTSPAAVRQILSRMVKNGDLRRLGRGKYTHNPSPQSHGHKVTREEEESQPL
jgi:hypothetical protein